MMADIYTKCREKFSKIAFKTITDSDLEHIDFSLKPSVFKLEGLHKYLDEVKSVPPVVEKTPLK